MLKILIEYPDKNEEKEIMKRVGFDAPEAVQPVLDPSEISAIGQVDQRGLHGRKAERLHRGSGLCHPQSGRPTTLTWPTTSSSGPRPGPRFF
jgi:hypothetical protein